MCVGYKSVVNEIHIKIKINLVIHTRFQYLCIYRRFLGIVPLHHH